MKKTSLSKSGKVKLCLLLVFIALVVGIYFISHWNDYFFRAVDANKVASVTVTITAMFEEPIAVETSDPLSIEKLTSIEDTVRRSDGVCRAIKTRTWRIAYEYRLTNGRVIRRSYKGQNAKSDLSRAFWGVPEIRRAIDEA